ncbi:hypothetical protein HD597_012222 [Nonomuraea thailandensis]|uniref:Ig-like domain-containing protein n=1 Tax=Nonomuraea thailandensis TaxID=1188745 RepID=A0A9X2GWM9_9ACTN|nr:hypothetical protein [Nonomuraea thailandensis]MCP2365202.1 hypothetical protein [Nonomuraea thailandensis]
MDNPGNGIAGFRLTEHTWMTELGNWIDAISPDGRRAGALLFDPKVIGLPGVRDRVVQAVMTDQRLVLAGLTGLIPVADVVAAGDQVWLLTAQAVSPTLADLMAAAPIDPNGAASLLVETAQTLLALHAAGITHGSVHPGTVVITAEGVSLLSERGLSDAIRARVSPRERDAAGWSSLARGLAASFGRGAPESAELFERVAATAQTLGLGTARDLLVNERGRLPGGRISRDGLARAARGRSAFAQPPSYARPPVPTPRDEGDIVTLLRVPGQSAGPLRSGGGVGTQPQGPPAGPLQFGPGIGTQPQEPETPAQRIWREGRDEAATVHRPGGRLAKASRARRRRTVLATVVFAVIMAGAVLAWFRLGNAPDLAVKSINVVAPKKTQGCGSAVMITGTVVTNGAPGEITYEWRKNLDKEVVKGTLRTKADQTSYTVPLRWTLQGRSSVKATATLRIITPGPEITDRATFTYKC